ncbi:MAG: hypothetical protein M0P43_04465 [Arcobacteraceae bacterium]|nr:hypothetical protein [Arcobacteraceae bacterium]MDY0327378.1 hypothetical protein [Arcobacteraceae bacterium]
MKILILLLTLAYGIYGNNYLFLMEKELNEIELESKIVAKIAQDLVGQNEVKVYLTHYNIEEQEAYKKFINITSHCVEADIIFLKKNKTLDSSCEGLNKIILTNSYQQFVEDDTIIGAFFWAKARPNIVFSKNRLKQNNITLPQSYNQFIEDL